MTVKQKIAITLDQQLVEFIDAQAGGNRSAYVSTLLQQQQEQLLKEQTIAALQEDVSNPHYLEELSAWDTVAEDGVNAEG